MNFTTLIDAATLVRLLADEASRAHLVLLDCRFDLANPYAGRQAYLSAHIPGARYADLNENLSSPVTAVSGRHPLPTPQALRAFLDEAGIGAPGAGTQVVAYDDTNGSFAARAWWLLRWLGQPQVAVLDGGFNSWRAAGGAVETDPPAQPPTRPTPSATRTALASPTPPVDWVISSAGLVQALRDPRRRLVDARASERFAGAVEPLDPVAGHVPGAVNHPFADNLDANGRFLPQDELRRRWLERLGGAAPADAISMCGSGVTACHNLLAMAHAGLPGATLYAGSWSEWVRDPDRPVARGVPQ